MLQQSVEKPRQRSKLRRRLGKEYYIAKRRLKWALNSRSFAHSYAEPLPHLLIAHKSTLLRPLKDVDMYLQHNKVTNLKLAIAPINRIVLKPNESFSIWRLVGRPTTRKGFLEGLVLQNGQIGKGIGGGLCQLGNLLYWMALHTPLQIVERWRHSYDVFPDINRTIPFACGATLSYNYIDLQLKNTSNSSIQILLWLDDEYLHGELRSDIAPTASYKVVETDHQIKLQWWGGYTRHNRIWRQRLDLQGNLEAEELIAENHAIMMYNPLLEAHK